MATITQLIILLLLLSAVLITSIPQIEISITIKEEVNIPDSIIKNLMDDPRIKAQFSPDEIENEIHFQYLSAAPVWFSVDSHGALRTTTWVDRDEICPNKVICKVAFDLAIQPVHHFTLIKIIIMIQDINDHNPIFSQPEVTHVLSESTRVGTSFVLPEVTDPDSPENSVQRVYLRPDRPEFELRVNTKPDGSQDIRVVLRELLDRETIPGYHMEVVALDGGDPPKSGTLELTITVADANDNHPTFDEDTYEVTMPENAQRGYSMLIVHASDLDSGLNSVIAYRWSPDTAASLGHIFSINNMTGEIIVRGKIDYEQASIIYLTVEARDLGADPIPAEAIVIVHIRDVNDHAPEILVHTLGGPGVHEVSVLEGAAAGTFVARVVVKDQDSGDNGRYNCSIHEDNFLLDPLGADFLITTREELDREQQAEYNLAISCRDFGRRPQTTVTYLLVKVQDVNDNRPRFTQAYYFWQVTENNLPGSTLLQVTAMDSDQGSNAEVEYSIQGLESQWFSVDSNSGLVRTTTSLDRELQAMYEISVIATDNGVPNHSATAILTVDIIDMNDEGPVFTQDVYIFRIYENEDPESEVGFIQAEDSDSIEFNQHTYSLNNDAGNLFQIGEITGRISTTDSLDREKQKVHTVIAVATDTSEPYLSSSATVSVYVMDRNDNPPRFTFPTPHNNTVYVSNSIPVGYIITKVHANDEDGESDGQVRYEMVQPSDQPDYFVVEPYLGTVTLVSSIHHIENATFSLTIIASDNGDVSMSTSAKLRLVVDNTLAANQRRYGNNIMPNVIIVIIVGCVSGVLIVALVLTIFIICRRRRRHAERQQRHKCQMEALKVLSAKEASGPYKESCCDKNVIDNVYVDNIRRDKKDCVPPPKYPDKYDYHSNHVIPAQLDISLEKSRQWLDQIKRDEDIPGSPKKDPDTESLNSGLGSNTDSGRGPSEQGDSRPVVEYGFIQGCRKDPREMMSPSALERGILRTSYKAKLKTFNVKPDNYQTSLQNNVQNVGRTHSDGGYQARSNPCQPRSLTPQPNKVVHPGAKGGTVFKLDSKSTPQKVQFDLTNNEPRDKPCSLDNSKRFEPIMFARCHGSLPRRTESHLAYRPSTYTSAHGYQGIATGTDKPGDTKLNKLPQKQGTIDSKNATCATEEDISNTQNYDVEDGGTITHVVNGVKVTDIIV